MKGGGDIVERIYINLLAQKKYQQNFPKSSDEYYYLKKCKPDLFQEYIDFLKAERERIESRLDEEVLSNTQYRSLENFRVYIVNILNSYNVSVNRGDIKNINKLWQESYSDILNGKEEDSAACETKSSAEDSESKIKQSLEINNIIVEIFEPLDAQSYLTEHIPSVSIAGNYVVVREEYFETHSLVGAFFSCCGCSF